MLGDINVAGRQGWAQWAWAGPAARLRRRTNRRDIVGASRFVVHDRCAPPWRHVCLVVQRRVQRGQSMCGHQTWACWVRVGQTPHFREHGTRESAQKGHDRSQTCVDRAWASYVFRSRAGDISWSFESWGLILGVLQSCTR